MLSITREEANEITDSKTLVHDRHRFEVKLDIDPPAGDTCGYRVDTYFFVPSALNITPNTYAKNLFYSSMQRYIRFKTPPFSLSRIVDPGEEASPLSRIRKGLDSISGGTATIDLTDAMFREIKMLGATTRGAIRDSVKGLLGLLARPGGGGDNGLREVRNGGHALAAEIETYVAAVQDLRHRLLEPVVPQKL